MSWKKFISSACAALLIISSLCGCNSEVETKNNSFDTEIASTEVTDTFIAQNDNYRLELNETTMGITLTDLKTGDVYGTSPVEVGGPKFDEFGMPIKRHPQLESVLRIQYLSGKKNVVTDAISYTGAVLNGRTTVKMLTDGVRIDYYFDDAQIMIPVTYTLRDNGVALTIDPKEVQEGENMLISVSLAPFWCSVENTDENGYLVYPSGSGSLIYAKEISQSGDSYSSAVYGEDATMELWDQISTEKAIKLPVFGSKFQNRATVGIIESGAESSLLDVTVGSTSIGYSSVYVKYQLRGYTNNIKELYNNRYYEGAVYANALVETPLTVGYYPLSGENADYSGMAATYREYLDETAGEVKTANNSKVDITMVGGTMISKSFLGFPYTTLFPTTTVSQAQDIIKELKELGVDVTSLNLSGFGPSGVDPQKLAGGFDIASKLGNAKDLSELQALCEAQNTNMFFDFDMVNFSESGSGYSAYFDSAVRANEKLAKTYNFHIATLGRLTDSSYSLLARDRFADTADKAVDTLLDWKLNGMGISTLSSIVYSDYTDEEDFTYYSKSGFGAQVSDVIATAKENSIKVLSSDANAYAAALSDVVLNAPTVSAGAFVFDADIPFYQIVFRGRAALSCESINLANDARTQLLRAVEGGCGLSYTLTANYGTELIDSNTTVFYNSLYSDLKDSIVSDYKSVSDYYEKISGAEIKEHKLHASGLRETVFSNGVTVYVNYGDSELSSPAGAVSAKGFLVWEGEV